MSQQITLRFQYLFMYHIHSAECHFDEFFRFDVERYIALHIFIDALPFSNPSHVSSLTSYFCRSYRMLQTITITT